MKKNSNYILLMGSLALLGCEDYLEQPVDQRTQLNTVEKVSELLTNAYPKADYVTFTEALSDLSGDKGTNDVVVAEENENPYLFTDVDSREQGSPSFYWNACYAAIASANHALEAIRNADNPQDYNAQKGEALLARAYAHHMLVTLFAKVYDPATADSDPGIPYVTEPEKEVFKDYERHTVAYVYEEIEKDLVQGLPLINNNAYRAPKYHFNTAAANAFAARFYLFKKEYQNVINYAHRVFPGGDISGYLRPWVEGYSGMTYQERIAVYTQATENANLLLVETPSLWARYYPRYRYGLSQAIINKILRRPNVTGATWIFPLFSGGNNNLFIPKFREHFVRTDPNANIGFPYTIFPLFTAEEVLFNRTEAYLEMGNLEAARQDLDLFASKRIEGYNTRNHKITNRKLEQFYGTQDPKEGLMAALLDFKAAEFIHEGMRWFDILRHDIEVVHPTVNGPLLTLKPEDKQRVLQIPPEVGLSGVEQNPRDGDEE